MLFSTFINTYLFFCLYSFHITFALQQVKWNAKPQLTWKWKNQHNIYYSYQPTNDVCESKPAILLLHGFGSSNYHWRHNILQLSEYYDVYAVDLIGFGKSDKPHENYHINLWSNQTLDFIENIIGKKTIIIGNSLGGSIAIRSSSHPLIDTIILINSYVKFKDDPALFQLPRPIFQFFVKNYFHYIKQPDKIFETLQYLYPVRPQQIDESLVESIVEPSNHPNALEILNSIIENILYSEDDYEDDNLRSLTKPLLLIWGTKDMWINKKMAEKIIHYCPQTKKNFVNAGHCPHDEIPESVNEIILQFLQRQI